MALGPLLLDLEGQSLTAEEREILRDPRVGGVILFSRNYESRAQIAALTAAIHALRSPRLLITVDHEGGRVQRFRAGFTVLPPAAAFGQAFDAAPEAALYLAEEAGWLLAAELRAVGVDFSFAPVLDLAACASHVIGDRAFHASPHAVSRLAQAVLRGMREAGMAAVGKHFPGHGSVAADSHHELPVDPRPYAEIRAADLIPFHHLAQRGIDAIMPAHVLYPAVDAVPPGFSRRWIQGVLRDELGFSGVVVSDDLSMAGAGGMGTPAERATAALAAGCDLLLVCNDRPAALAVLASQPTAPNPINQVRFMRLHGRGPIPTDADLFADPRWLAARDQLARLLPPV